MPGLYLASIHQLAPPKRGGRHVVVVVIVVVDVFASSSSVSFQRLCMFGLYGYTNAVIIIILYPG